MKMRLELKGAEEMERALGELGEELANKAGRAAVRASANELRDELKETAPYRAGASTLKSRRSKSGVVTYFDYGHLRDNIRARRDKERKPYTIRYIVNFGHAFWAYFREVGTVHQKPHPWAVPTFQRMQRRLLNTMLDTLRKRTKTAARRIARKNGKARIGHNGGPRLED